MQLPMTVGDIYLCMYLLFVCYVLVKLVSSPLLCLFILIRFLLFSSMAETTHPGLFLFLFLYFILVHMDRAFS